jgi:hypothetical protein
MEQLREVALRIVVLCLALLAPLGVATLLTGTPPPTSMNVTELDQWSPVRDPGPTTSLLARGLTIAGVGETRYPDWFKAEDAKLLGDAKAELERNKLQAAMGHLMVLSSRIEDQGKTLSDFLPIVVPDLASWIIANYFAPILLGTLFVALTLLVFGPWLARRFYDFLKLLTTLILALIGIGFAASLCFAIASQKALVFSLIEYLAMVAVLLSVGNLAVSWNQRRYAARLAGRHRFRRRGAVVASEEPNGPRLRIVTDPNWLKNLPSRLSPEEDMRAKRVKFEADELAKAPETACTGLLPSMDKVRPKRPGFWRRHLVAPLTRSRVRPVRRPLRSLEEEAPPLGI